MTRKKLPPPADWDDSTPLPPEMLAEMRPLIETHPEIVEAARRVRGKQKAPTKKRVTMYLDADVLEEFKKDGRGWQTRINDKLRATVMGK
jgi:uncharacterized protein (DUF4415 family)